MPFNLAARFSMSWLSFSLVIFAYICVVFMLLCPSMELTVSMGTPLERNTVVAAVCREQLIQRLFDAKHFQGHWWSYICDEQPENSFEYWISKYMIPITIDQRYGKEEIKYLSRVIHNE